MTSTEHRGEHPAGLRPTRQRRAVAEAIASFDDFRSAQEIHELLGRRGEAVGLATVYRTLQRLADAGEIDPGLVQKAFDRYKIDDPTATKGVKQEGGDA